MDIQHAQQEGETSRNDPEDVHISVELEHGRDPGLVDEGQDGGNETISQRRLERRWRASSGAVNASSVSVGSNEITSFGQGSENPLDKGHLNQIISPRLQPEPRSERNLRPGHSVDIGKLENSSKSDLRTLHSVFDLQDAPAALQASKTPPAAVPNPKDYHRFYWKCMGLKSELVRLDFALRPLGSGGPGIHAANTLKTKLRQLRDLFGINTSILFPRDVNVQIYTPGNSKAYISQMSRSLEDFAEGLDMTAKALYGFNGVYHDEGLMLLLFSLHKRFMAEAMKISICNGVRHTRAAEELKLRFQMLLKEWIEIAVDTLTEAVKDFNDKGVRSIYSAQQHKTTRYLDMTTIATFFSAVTASMIQFTINNNSSAVGVATNTFMFSSLVFSIGSAVNSLLVTSWRRSCVREPDQALSVWFSAWLNAGPMISLIVAGAFFSVALCLLMFSSNQHEVTTAVILCFSGLHAAGLLLLSMSFISEKWKFRREAGSIGEGLMGDSLTLSVMATALSWITSLKRMQGQQALRKAREGLSKDIEAQYTPPEKIEPFESFQSQALQNALSDEKFLLNRTYVHDLSTNSSTGRTPDPKHGYGTWNFDFTPQTADKPVSPLSPYVQMKGPMPARKLPQVQPLPVNGWRGWGRDAAGAPLPDLENEEKGVLDETPVDFERYTSEPMDIPHLHASIEQSRARPLPKRGSLFGEHTPEDSEEPTERGELSPLALERALINEDEDGEDEYGGSDVGRRMLEQLERYYQAHRLVRSAWRAPQPYSARLIRKKLLRQSGRAQRNLVRPAVLKIPQPTHPPVIHYETVEGVTQAESPQISSDIRTAALFLEPAQSWTSRQPLSPSVPDYNYRSPPQQWEVRHLKPSSRPAAVLPPWDQPTVISSTNEERSRRSVTPIPPTNLSQETQAQQKPPVGSPT